MIFILFFNSTVNMYIFQLMLVMVVVVVVMVVVVVVVVVAGQPSGCIDASNPSLGMCFVSSLPVNSQPAPNCPLGRRWR